MLALHDWVVTVPHGVVVPALTGLAQFGTPVAQEFVPLMQTLPPGLHGAFGMHVEQVPALQNMFDPHEVPGGEFVAEQTGRLVAVAQVVTPCLQVTAGVNVHALPAPEHRHWPPLQICPVPHLVPHDPQFCVSVCRLLHVPLQLVCPDPQQIPLEQTWPDEHTVPQLPQLVVDVNATHTFEQQLCPEPQQTPLHGVVPAAHDRQSVPAALHPLAQLVVAGVGHCPFALQTAAAVFTVPLHDWPAPHVVPLDLFELTVHIELPVEHDVVPFWQALGWQVAPWVQDAHVPLRQNRFIPQFIPSDAAVLVSMHTTAPVEHEMVP